MILDDMSFYLTRGSATKREAWAEERVELQRLSRTPEQELAWGSPCARAGEQEQTQWCALDQDEADDPVPGVGSIPIS